MTSFNELLASALAPITLISGVGLLIMMGLRDLNVKLRPQHTGHRLQSPDEHRNAQ